MPAKPPPPPAPPREAARPKKEEVGLFEVALISALSVGVLLALWAKRVLDAPSGPGWPADLAEHGQFGDSFGPITALFSAFALCGAIASFWMQLQELKAQRASGEKQAEALSQVVTQLGAQAGAVRDANKISLAMRIDQLKTDLEAADKDGLMLSGDMVNGLGAALATHFRGLTAEDIWFDFQQAKKFEDVLVDDKFSTNGGFRTIWGLSRVARRSKAAIASMTELQDGLTPK